MRRGEEELCACIEFDHNIELLSLYAMCTLR